jgi:hypothetical protein
MWNSALEVIEVLSIIAFAIGAFPLNLIAFVAGCRGISKVLELDKCRICGVRHGHCGEPSKREVLSMVRQSAAIMLIGACGYGLVWLMK